MKLELLGNSSVISRGGGAAGGGGASGGGAPVNAGARAAAGGGGGAAADGGSALSSGIQKRQNAPVVVPTASRIGANPTAGAGANTGPARVLAARTGDTLNCPSRNTVNCSSRSIGPLPVHPSSSSSSTIGPKWGSSYYNGAGSSRKSKSLSWEVDLESVVEKLSAEGAVARAVQHHDDGGLLWSSNDSHVMGADASWNGKAGEAMKVPPNTPCSGEYISLLSGSRTTHSLALPS